MELLSHIITIFFEPIGCGTRKSNGKALKLWEKISLGKKGSLFCISVMHTNKDCCFTEDFLGFELYKRRWIKIWCPKNQDQCSPVFPFWVSFFCILKWKPNWAEMQDWEAAWAYLKGPCVSPLTSIKSHNLKSFLRTQFGWSKHSFVVYGFSLQHTYS